jgi:hypothetical protein
MIEDQMNQTTKWLRTRIRVFAPLTLIALVALPFGSAQGPRLISTRIIDNERLSVSHSTLPPGLREKMHLYPQDVVIIQLTPGEVEATIGEEKTSGHQEAGKTWYVSKTTERSFANIGKEPYDHIVVFLK